MPASMDGVQIDLKYPITILHHFI